MSLDYYLYCRISYDNILKKLDTIIYLCEDINEATLFEKKIEKIENESIDVFNNENNKHFFIQKKTHIEHLRKICNEKVLELCSHNFIEDLIDITPDRSETIRYCDICGYTKNK